MCLSKELCQMYLPLDSKTLKQRSALSEFLNGYIECHCPMGGISHHIP
jgi:hypothetical protein